MVRVKKTHSKLAHWVIIGWITAMISGGKNIGHSYYGNWILYYPLQLESVLRLIFSGVPSKNGILCQADSGSSYIWG